MQWFSRARPLDQNDAVYDIFTVSKPKQQQRKKRARPKSVQHQASVHDLHAEYDRAAKRLLKPATNGFAPQQCLQFIDDQALDKSQEVVKEYQEQLCIESMETSILCASQGQENRQYLGQKPGSFASTQATNETRLATAFAVDVKSIVSTISRDLCDASSSASISAQEQQLFEFSMSDLVEYEIHRLCWQSDYKKHESIVAQRLETDAVAYEAVSKKQEACEVETQLCDKKPFRRFVEVPLALDCVFKVLSAPKEVKLLLVGNENLNYTFRQAVCGFNLACKQFAILLEIGNRFRLECDIYWQQQTQVHADVFEALRAGQHVNHFQKVAEIVEKGSFFKKMRALAFANQRFAKIVVQTYLVPNQLHNLLQDNYGKSNVYIIKPVNLSRGRGIFLTRDPMRFTDCKSIVQLYVQDPLLHCGRKIDFRIYVLVDSEHSYLYYDGLVRQAQRPFTMESLENEVHLTNTSLNGSKCKLRISTYLNGLQNREQIIHALKLAAQAVERLASKISSPQCFELLGCDVLLSADYEPFLLEINSSPNLVYSCTADQVKVELLQDVFGLLLSRKMDNWIAL